MKRRRDVRALEALGRQLAREDPALAAQLSLPAGKRSGMGDARGRRRHPGILAGKVLLLVGLVFIGWGLLVASPTATILGSIAVLICWLPWHFAWEATRR
ncbi:DUF3040 domain-containing protein [Pseudonocardia sp. ICBG601]|uniref:DUF3040 domain-containing protein n=1 Tax=Pseudonocardia sp. ICBG601 TaxID=2846759 RepID=UPI001CF6C268|nr:DUF3040 domain-containing protein [Pseudonocardia sp. ICBG601]